MSSAACASAGLRQAWDDEPAGVSDGVVVRLSLRTEGCSDEASCSFPVGPVAVLVAGDGERRGGPPFGRRGRRERLGAQHRLGERQPWKQRSDGASIDGREVSVHPYLARQMSHYGFRKPLKGSNFGVRTKEHSLPILPAQ